jgi:hypothetical protein
MPILYCCIAEGKTVVAQAGDKAKFKKIAKVILERLDPNENRKSYIHQSYVRMFIVVHSKTKQKQF